MHQLQQALRARSVIDQAIGVLMAQERCQPDVAFDMLRLHSQHNNRKIRDVAVELVTRVTGHAPGEPAPFSAIRTRAARRPA
jgi:AmiR/NasT family two-component response regulator